jgi:hypothetical protein
MTLACHHLDLLLTLPLAAPGDDAARLLLVSPPQLRPDRPIIRGKSTPHSRVAAAFRLKIRAHACLSATFLHRRRKPNSHSARG